MVGTEQSSLIRTLLCTFHSPCCEMCRRLNSVVLTAAELAAGERFARLHGDEARQYHLRSDDCEREDFERMSTHPLCYEAIDFSGPAEGDTCQYTGYGVLRFRLPSS